METRANYVAIGLFTLILTAIGFGFVYWIARYDDARPMSQLVVRFQGSVAGLNKGALVLFNGIKVGEVESLNYDPTHPQFVKANLKVDSAIPLKKDSSVELSFQGLTGVGQVLIKGGSKDLPNLLDSSETPEILARKSAFEDLMSGAREILSKADTILKKVESVVDINESRINNSVENIETFTAALKNNAENVDTFLTDVSSAAKGLTSLSAKLETLSGKAETLIGAVEPESVKKSVKNVEIFSTRLAEASDKFDVVVNDATKAAKSFNEFSSNLNTSLGKVDDLVASVDPDAVRASIASLSGFAQSLDSSSEDIKTIVGEAKDAASNINKFSASMTAREKDFNLIITDVKELAGRLNQASKRVDGLLGKADDLLSDKEGGKSLIEEMTLAARSIRKVSQNFEARSAEISNGLARFSGKGLRDVELMVGQARQTLNKLESAVGKIENNPSHLIFGGPKVKTYNRRH